MITIERVTHLVDNIYGNLKCILVRYGDFIIYATPGEIEIYFLRGSRKEIIGFLAGLVYNPDSVLFRSRNNNNNNNVVVRLRGKPIPLDTDGCAKLLREFNGSVVDVQIDAKYVLRESEHECLKCFCDYVDECLTRGGHVTEVMNPLLIRDIREIVVHTSEEEVLVTFPVVKVLLVSRDHRIDEREWQYYDSIHKIIPGTLYTPPLPSSSYLYTVSYYSDEKSKLNYVLSRLGGGGGGTDIPIIPISSRKNGQ